MHLEFLHTFMYMYLCVNWYGLFLDGWAWGGQPRSSRPDSESRAAARIYAARSTEYWQQVKIMPNLMSSWSSWAIGVFFSALVHWKVKKARPTVAIILFKVFRCCCFNWCTTLYFDPNFQFLLNSKVLEKIFFFVTLDAYIFANCCLPLLRHHQMLPKYNALQHWNAL